ncbi:MAG: GNAT family N-acetyltransferase [Tannerellaceae bacterium]|jgi:ribosomal protein S18 acetylase RimI-like enzyme|nr:GNAT family N-acetyltransferase [Tannerellaceae bacterium]
MNSVDTKIIWCDYTNADHLNAVGELLNAYIADEMGGGEPLTKLQQQRLTDGLGQHPASIVLLALVDEAFCGLLVAFENFSTFKVSPMINIHDLIVLPEYRGKGIGRRLLQAVVDIGEQKNCNRITLEVRKDNLTAQQLYKNMGFADTDPPMYYWRRDVVTL